MRRAVVDTNVLLVANRDHDNISEKCVITCIEAIDRLRTGGVTVIDEQRHILDEYQRKLDLGRGQPGVGDTFVKWLLQRQADPKRVVQVPVNETADNWFEEFPNHELQGEFDPSDRKFIAVAAADTCNAPILQAADCKWLNWWQPLAAAGIHIRFICPDDVERFYAGKFPDQPMPEFPADA